MSGPFTSEVHVPKPLGAEERKKLDAAIKKGMKQPLYVYRKVENGAEIERWAKANGFETTLPPADMHVTICFSKEPVDWLKMGEPYNWSPDDGERRKGTLIIPAGGPRVIERFGPERNVAVLGFASSTLSYRHRDFRDKGASWDFPDYVPHITLSFAPGSLDLDALKPYTGEIILGPEIFEPLNEKWSEKVVEKSAGDQPGEEFAANFFKVAAIDEELGVVFGWGIVCKQSGADYWDPQGNHVPEYSMLDATTDFMKASRAHGEMHFRSDAGLVVHSFPLTTEIAKQMGITCDRSGWMVGVAPEPAVLAKFKSGDYKGFSIGGKHILLDGKPVGAGA